VIQVVTWWHFYWLWASFSFSCK